MFPPGQQHRAFDQPFAMNQQVSESMGQATGHSAGNKIDTDPNIAGAWILRRPWRPKLPFDRLQIGGSAQLPNFTKQELKAFVETIKTEVPKQDEEQINDDAIIKFVARPHMDAIRYAVHATATQPPSNPPRLVMFTDGSVKSRHNVGCGITYKRFYGADHNWVDAAYGSKGISDLLDHEAIALHRGLWIAYYELMDWAGRVPNPLGGGRTTPPKVIIITDGLSGIQRLHYSYCYTKLEIEPHNKAAIHEYLVYPLEKLVKFGSKVEIHWTPGHVGVEGNTRADSLASVGADYAIEYSHSTGLGITDLMLPLSNHMLGQKTRPAYPFHLGSPMNDFIHWHKQETRVAIRVALHSNEERGAADFIEWLAKASLSNKISKATLRMLKKKKRKAVNILAKRKTGGLLNKAGKLFDGVFPPKDSRNSGTSQSKRRAHDEDDVDDLNDLLPHPKRQKADTGNADQSCITQ
ncbi:hypothetical protein F4813DRAFT_253346 [Daldinia decipiens]|uniref:uncharacterized protein n=1 Tax=Daldinia decipiens TaxID=326647 RepID=UPI0020C3F495|nr:uncharacterized protein F4813DRAFT_253346 [Daldinia decipiens]KAI1653442.1 hypothetical protein F4813DRAFT_253346 [Daldinia decipiens]